jgi:hypothetical protein
MTDSRDTYDSTQRELLIEHLFVGEVMREMWRRGLPHLQVSKPQADNSGYDLILEEGKVIRHVQLKSSLARAKAAGVKVHLALAAKPSGCVIWVRFDPQTLALGPFLWFGGAPGDPLPPLSAYRIAKHTKGNSTGFKAERPNLRVVPKSRFTSLASIEEVINRLFAIEPGPAV